MKPINKILQGNSLEQLKIVDTEIVDCVVTSPPYWGLRDYGVDGQLGLESSFDEYVNKLCDIFDEVKRVLKPEGTCWVNLGDSYAAGGGMAIEKSAKRQAAIDNNAYPDNAPNAKLRNKLGKSRLLIPERFAIEMLNRGWLLRNTIIWHKPSCLPESVKDRFTNDYEYIYFFVKQKEYFFNQQFEPLAESSIGRYQRGHYDTKYEEQNASGTNINKFSNNAGENIEETIAKGRNMRTLWSFSNVGTSEGHHAAFPNELVRRCIESGCPEKGLVLDPFLGSGTTAYVAKNMGRKYLGCELNPEYVKIAENKLRQEVLF